MTKSFARKSGAAQNRDVGLPDHDRIVTTMLIPVIFRMVCCMSVHELFDRLFRRMYPTGDEYKPDPGEDDAREVAIKRFRSREDFEAEEAHWKGVSLMDTELDATILSEVPIKKSKEWIVGYSDLFASKASFVDGTHILTAPYGDHRPGDAICVEVKGRNVSFGETMRQINTYRTFMPQGVIFAVVAPMGCMDKLTRLAFERHNVRATEVDLDALIQGDGMDAIKITSSDEVDLISRTGGFALDTTPPI